jgi:hypothetical protein
MIHINAERSQCKKYKKCDEAKELHKASFGLKEILEEKKNDLSPHSKNSSFFLQNSFNSKEP